MRVAVVGSINADLVLRVPTLPVGGVTMPATDLHRLPGGKGANQAVAFHQAARHRKEQREMDVRSGLGDHRRNHRDRNAPSA